MLVRDDAVLVVVDIQDVLLPKKEEIAALYLKQASKLIRMAKALAMPILVTEQYPERLGTSSASIMALLGDIPRLPKMEFGCLANAAFLDALHKTGKRQLVIVGMETHVCVLQTALEALDQGYDVFIVKDAVVSSRKYDYKAGIARMEKAGAVIATTEMVVFELLRKAGTPEFKQVLPLIKE